VHAPKSLRNIGIGQPKVLLFCDGPIIVEKRSAIGDNSIPNEDAKDILSPITANHGERLKRLFEISTG
jgi:hypothetical protein